METAKKDKEGDQDDEVVAVGSSSEDTTVKEGRKKRVLKRLRLCSSKQQKTSASSTPTQSHFLRSEDTAKSPFLTQGRSKKAADQSDTGMAGVNKKRNDQFCKRKVIAERLVDMMETDQKSSMESTVSSLGSYVEKVVAEFYAGLPDTKVEADTIRGHLYKFSPAMINEAQDLVPLSEEEEEEDTTLDAIPVTELADLHEALEDTSRALQALTDIVKDLMHSVAGGEDEE
ncbi:hypothetical protein Bca52824_016490 [Brassica carinata]|uniref:Uncharacterized protein n=1 Tax=Brassica carinata TaxID=52824 RepID=A0A8X8B6P9_BRACI|nr:hypothetical protein Bca52824_016490 [Brassica carinata]